MCRLACHGVLSGLFTDQRRVAFEVKKIVRDLERLADRRPVAFERFALRRIRRTEDASGRTGKTQERAGLHRLQGQYAAFVELERHVAGKAAFGREIEHLAPHHPAKTRCPGERTDELELAPRRQDACRYGRGYRTQV